MKIWLVAALAAAGVFAVACILVIGRNPLRQAVLIGSADRAFHSHRLNVLLLGYQDDEGNSDSLILAHLDIDRRLATLVSIPRDTWVEIPGHGHQKINRQSASVARRSARSSLRHLLALRSTQRSPSNQKAPRLSSTSQCR